MKIALIGASGFIGSVIAVEAFDRNYLITGIATRPERLQEHPNLTACQGDVFNTEHLAALLKGHDAVISAYSPGKESENAREKCLEAARSIIAATKQAGVKRLIIVGGAGSLELPSGELVLNTPEFPEEWREAALGMKAVLDLLKRENELDWTFFSPAAMILPGTKTRKYRLGKDQLIIDKDGISHISNQDYAIALLDELERPQHIRERFTIGY